jgi:hypothetical protein
MKPDGELLKLPTVPLTTEKKVKNNWYVLNRQAICFRFFIETIKDNNYKIIATSNKVGKDDSLAWIEERRAILY